MKKRIFIFLSIAICFIMASCASQATDDGVYVDDPKASIVTQLGLDKINKSGDTITGKVLNEAVDTIASEYTQIIVAEDIKSSLFVYVTELDELLSEKGNSVTNLIINGMSFRAARDEDKSAAIAAVNDTTYGLNSLGLSLPFEVNITSWSYAISPNEAIEAYNAGTRNNVLATVYLPVYVYHVKDNKKYSAMYMMVPVFQTITTYDGATLQASSLTGITVQELEIVDGYLASEIVE